MSKRGGRKKYKQWRNGKSGAWTARITWYHRRDRNQRMTDIRLRLELVHEDINDTTTEDKYPNSIGEADTIWKQFLTDHPRSELKITQAQWNKWVHFYLFTVDGTIYLVDAIPDRYLELIEERLAKAVGRVFGDDVFGEEYSQDDARDGLVCMRTDDLQEVEEHLRLQCPK